MISGSTEELSGQPIELIVEERAHGWRVDHYLSRLFPNYSRSLLQQAIKQQAVLLNGETVKASRRLYPGDTLSVGLPTLPDNSLPPEDLPITILYEDDALIVLNKAPGMIVHPGKGNYSGTLAAALQFHFDSLSNIAGSLRPGIVHRLDKDTSGVLVVAKDNQVHHKLAYQFEQRTVQKEYRAIAYGEIERDSDYIERWMRVRQKHREKMTICAKADHGSRFASTYYEVLKRFEGYTYVKLLPKTGRTHQLRLHLLHIKHPIVADLQYAGRSQLKSADLNGSKDQSAQKRVLISRQALHAYRLTFTHPVTEEPVSFEAPLPEDFQRTLNALEQQGESAS